jgi:glycosyltransferase involved in cell wall biosynthesis
VSADRTVHLVYPHGLRISAPDSIGRNLGQRLESAYRVRYYDWDADIRIVPEPGDVLLGHPHPAPGTCFRRSMLDRRWGRVIALCPYNHDPSQNSFLDQVIPHVNEFLAITGRYWFDSLDESIFSHWAPRMTRVDMAVDPKDYPLIKSRFSPAGERRFVYIGHSGWPKNTHYLAKLAALRPGLDIAWIGEGGAPLPGLRPLGAADFSDDSARSLVSEFDFLVTVGLHDANPTTVLEAMSWGLIPVCTPQSGYYGCPGIVNVPGDDPDRAARILDDLNSIDELDLLKMQRVNRQLVDTHFTWERFAGQVVTAIESTETALMRQESLTRRLRIRFREFTSPYSPIRRSPLAQRLLRRVGLS